MKKMKLKHLKTFESYSKKELPNDEERMEYPYVDKIGKLRDMSFGYKNIPSTYPTIEQLIHSFRKSLNLNPNYNVAYELDPSENFQGIEFQKDSEDGLIILLNMESSLLTDYYIGKKEAEKTIEKALKPFNCYLVSRDIQIFKVYPFPY